MSKSNHTAKKEKKWAKDDEIVESHAVTPSFRCFLIEANLLDEPDDSGRDWTWEVHPIPIFLHQKVVTWVCQHTDEFGPYLPPDADDRKEDGWKVDNVRWQTIPALDYGFGIGPSGVNLYSCDNEDLSSCVDTAAQVVVCCWPESDDDVHFTETAGMLLEQLRDDRSRKKAETDK